ncbi:hypothetical protein ACFOVU_27275 [Nocardiopsis sediminis]|uniref:Uncharacterized protein n=1 Tax=Nocardiopsis sediminis TaxID=1778267 RepID=A0ABV8FYC8_9ACTN
MDLKDHYQRLLDGIGLAIQAADDAFPLHPPFRRLLHRWAQEELAARKGDIDWCDSTQDLADVTSGLLSFARDYTELRRALFSDHLHLGPEPPWRIVGSPHARRLAVRVPLSFYRETADHFVLRVVGAAQVDVRAWEFTVLTRASGSDSDDRFTLTAGTDVVVHIPPELSARPDWTEQAFYGLRCLTGDAFNLRPFPDT